MPALRAADVVVMNPPVFAHPRPRRGRPRLPVKPSAGRHSAALCGRAGASSRSCPTGSSPAARDVYAASCEAVADTAHVAVRTSLTARELLSKARDEHRCAALRHRQGARDGLTEAVDDPACRRWRSSLDAVAVSTASGSCRKLDVKPRRAGTQDRDRLDVRRGARGRKAAPPRPTHAPIAATMCCPSAITTLDAPAPLAEQVGVYLPYRPSRIVFDTAGEHPTALVESVAMGSIPAPIPGHIAKLPERTVAERMLSASQLETVIYAGPRLEPAAPRHLQAGQGRRRPHHRSGGPTATARASSWAMARVRAKAARSLPASSTTGCKAGAVTSGSARTSRCSKTRVATGPRLAACRPTCSQLSNWKIDQPIKLDRGRAVRHLSDTSLDALRP